MEMVCESAEPLLRHSDRSERRNSSMLVGEFEFLEPYRALAILSTQRRNLVSISTAEVAG